jgi:hypothetical protein
MGKWKERVNAEKRYGESRGKGKDIEKVESVKEKIQRKWKWKSVCESGNGKVCVKVEMEKCV